MTNNLGSYDLGITAAVRHQEHPDRTLKVLPVGVSRCDESFVRHVDLPDLMIYVLL